MKLGIRRPNCFPGTLGFPSNICAHDVVSIFPIYVQSNLMQVQAEAQAMISSTHPYLNHALSLIFGNLPKKLIKYLIHLFDDINLDPEENEKWLESLEGAT